MQICVCFNNKWLFNCVSLKTTKGNKNILQLIFWTKSFQFSVAFHFIFNFCKMTCDLSFFSWNLSSTPKELILKLLKEWVWLIPAVWYPSSVPTAVARAWWQYPAILPVMEGVEPWTPLRAEETQLCTPVPCTRLLASFCPSQTLGSAMAEIPVTLMMLQAGIPWDRERLSSSHSSLSQGNVSSSSLPMCAASSSSSSSATHSPVCWCCCLATVLWWAAWRGAMIKQPELASESRDLIVMWQAVTAQTATHSECDSWKKRINSKHTGREPHTPVCRCASADAFPWCRKAGRASVSVLMEGEHNPNKCHDEQISPRARAACTDAVTQELLGQQLNGILQVLAAGGCTASRNNTPSRGEHLQASAWRWCSCYGHLPHPFLPASWTGQVQAQGCRLSLQCKS